MRDRHTDPVCEAPPCADCSQLNLCEKMRTDDRTSRAPRPALASAPQSGAVGSTRNSLRGFPRSTRWRFYHVPISKSAIISRFVQDSPTATAVNTGNLENLRKCGTDRLGEIAGQIGPNAPTPTKRSIPLTVATAACGKTKTAGRFRGESTGCASSGDVVNSCLDGPALRAAGLRVGGAGALVGFFQVAVRLGHDFLEKSPG